MVTTALTKQKNKFSRVTLGTRREITIPESTVKRLGLMTGQELELRESKKGILLTPAERKKIPKDQRWFYTLKWQKMMQEAYEDVKKGRLIGPFDSAEEAIRALKETKV
ncbi:MAG: Transcriptional regulator, AbrB family [Parcubacteria group bacterium Gr01-1014_33]|nr:MAG: Transcriptional regulator, AbrB family [Parcubacteria group bacterium Gr01-1014_33]